MGAGSTSVPEGERRRGADVSRGKDSSPLGRGCRVLLAPPPRRELSSALETAESEL